MGPHTCINTLAYFLGIQIPNLLLDLSLMLLPLPWLWRLKIALSHRIALSGIFTLGGLVIVVGALRLATIAVTQHSSDFTFDLIDLGVWTAVETNTGVVCACLPSMGPLLRLCLHGSIGTRESSKGKGKRIESRASRPSAGGGGRFWHGQRPGVEGGERDEVVELKSKGEKMGVDRADDFGSGGFDF